MTLLANAVVYVVLYLLFMIPTYILPYFGSNSAAANAMVTAASSLISPALLCHAICLVALMVGAWFRGSVIEKRWLIIFPILAAVFDLVPGLSLIPLVPTVMHLLAIILGVAGVAPNATQNTNR